MYCCCDVNIRYPIRCLNPKYKQINANASFYMFPLFTGSLGTSIFDMQAFLVGASGGVYALLAGHLANILLVRASI